MAGEMHPSSRHDGKGWIPSDVRRESLSGHPLNARGAVLFIKGDWSEYGSTMGFSLWADGLRPCFLCNVNLPDLDENEEIADHRCVAREPGR